MLSVRQSVKEFFLFLFINFVQVQITMPENVAYITELIADYFYKALGRTVLGPTGVNLCMVLYLTLEECVLVLL